MAKLRRMHTTRIMVLLDNTWRPAYAVPDSYNNNDGSIQATVNGLIVLIKGGAWYNLDNTMSDEQITANAITSNIEQLFQVAANKAVHKKTQEMIAERNRRAEQLAVAAREREIIGVQPIPFPAEPAAVVAEPQPQPQPEQPPVVEREFEDFDEDDYYEPPYEFGECDCEDCQRARGDI